MTYRFLYIVRVAVVVTGAFLFVLPVVGATDSVIITEIGAYEPSGQEWLEIYNNGAAPVDLTGWKFFENDTNHGLSLAQGGDAVLEPGEYGVIAQKDDVFIAAYPNVIATIFDSAWGSLKESGEPVALKDADGNVVEQFTYIAAPTFSLERMVYDLADYSSANWQEHADSNTVGAQNSSVSNGLSTEETVAPVRINEFVPNPETDANEWIELFHSGSSDADLAGWTLEDGVGTVSTLDQTISAQEYLVVELSSSKLNNAGDIVVLKNSDGDIVDQIAYGNWEGAAVIAPAKGKSVSFINGSFVETDATKGSANQASSSDSETAPTSAAPLSTRSIEASTIVINEFVSDPADEMTEFVELYNRSTKTMELADWWLEDGGESKTTLDGSIEPKGFVVVEKPKGHLNNGGDQLSLYEPNGILIDRVAYGSWDDGRAYDNAPVASDPQSVARKQDGYDTDIDSNDFAKTALVTKGSPNQFPAPASPAHKQKESADIDIVISELFPNPIGSDSEHEFIEVYNAGDKRVDLSGWQLSDGSTKQFTIQDIVIEPGMYRAFLRSDTSIALNNSGGDEAVLRSAAGDDVDRVAYKGRAPEGQAYAKQDSEWAWSLTPSPGAENVIEVPNELPIVHIESADSVGVTETIMFDASDSADTDGEIISYIWDFGDSTTSSGSFVQHHYTSAGTFTVTLFAEDDRGAVVSQTKDIDVVPRYVVDPTYDIGIRISEFMPNPAGSDSAEFIEVFNDSQDVVDISGLQLDDEDGGSHPFSVPNNTALEAGEYRVFEKKQTGLALNNTQDSVRLLYPNGDVIHEVVYDNVVEDASYMFLDTNWVWTGSITPGTENVFSEPTQTTGTRTKARSNKPIVPTSLARIREFDPGDRVSVTGTVAVLPGVFGSQYFYIAGSGGVQVYQNKKEFPSLSVGDEVHVVGTLSQAYGEYRLKVASAEDIRIANQEGQIAPQRVDIADIGDEYEGNVVLVAGEITELKTSHMYVDDGTEEVRVYFKKGADITKKSYTEGQLLEVVGVVSERNGVFQLLPRSAADISIVGSAEEEQIISAASGDESKDVAETYLTATAGGLTSILIGLFARARGALAVGFAKRVGSVAVGSVKRWWG